MVHLHVHSEYSLRDSIIRISDLITRVKELSMTAVALTDHGNLSGAFEFYIECIENDIKPIIGIECYVVADAEIKMKDDKRYHLVLLAQDRTGYQNLLKIASWAGTDGFYYVPRADLHVIHKYSDGLIAMTACLQSALYMAGEHFASVRRMGRLLNNIFPGKLYLELMPHVLQKQRQHNLMLYNLGEELGLPFVVTQDCHYLDEAAGEAHAVLMKILGREPYTVDLHMADKAWTFKTMCREHKYLSREEISEAMWQTDDIANLIEDYALPIEQFDFPKFRR